jgi:hypothetical protein
MIKTNQNASISNNFSSFIYQFVINKTGYVKWQDVINELGKLFSICQREKGHGNLNQDSWSLDEDLNPGPPPYGVLTTKPQHSASV